MKIERSDFISIVGFYGDTAIVNKKIQKKIRKLSLSELLEQGFYKEAVSFASYEEDITLKDKVLEFFQNLQPVENFEFLEREFGINVGELSKIKKLKKI